METTDAFNIPKILFFAADGVTPVPSASHPSWHYTQIGVFRTQKGGPPQKLVNGTWVNL